MSLIELDAARASLHHDAERLSNQSASLSMRESIILTT